MENQDLVKAVLQAGATKAVILPQSQIVLSDSFRKICESNQCGGYGKCWMCPPHIGEIHALMDEVRSFPQGVWFQTIHPIEDSFDIEGMFAAGGKHAQVSVAIREAVKPLLKKTFLLLSCGGCHICESCAIRENRPCRFPDKALASLEGYGVDVYNTTKDTDLRYINGQNTVTYFGIVLFTE